MDFAQLRAETSENHTGRRHKRRDLNTPILARLQVGMGAKHFPTRSSYESTHLEFATLKKMRCVLLSSESHMFPRKLTWETSRSKLKKQTQTKRTRAQSVQNCSLTDRVRHPDGINVGLLGSVWHFLSMSGPSLLAQSNHALEETMALTAIIRYFASGQMDTVHGILTSTWMC